MPRHAAVTASKGQMMSASVGPPREGGPLSKDHSARTLFSVESAVSKTSNNTPPRSPRNKIPQTPISDELIAAIRSTMRAELGDALDSRRFKDALRLELIDALRAELASVPDERLPAASRRAHERETNGDKRGSAARGSGAKTAHFESEDSADRKAEVAGDYTSEAIGASRSSVDYEGRLHNHFANLVKSVTQHDLVLAESKVEGSRSLVMLGLSQSTFANWISDKAFHLYVWAMNLEEPPRNSLLAVVMNSKVLEVIVFAVILLNCVFMIYAADQGLLYPQAPPELVKIGDWGFQIFYTLELVLKLCVHHQWYFCNANWKLNWFDLFLVLSGWAGLLGDAAVTGTFMRILRIVKLGKAMRALKVMAQFRYLRTFLVCIQGSVTPFFWSVTMLCVVFLIFSLFFVQMVEGYLRAEDTPLQGELSDMFGSVFISMLTLCKASTGGDDWSAAFNVINQVGTMSSFVFLFFVFFVQLALINIITGIFVDAAMQCLSPDQETQALELYRQEMDYARDLDTLCRLIDKDFTGLLTPDDFGEGMKKGRLPQLLYLLGLKPQNVDAFFSTLSEVSEDGNVDITEFVKGCMQLKGQASNYDLQILHAEITAMQSTQERLMNRMSTQISAQLAQLWEAIC